MTDRRAFLGLAALAGGGLVFARRALTRDVPVRALNANKFDASGGVRPFAGNTVICHLDQQGENTAAFDTLLDIYREAKTHAFARRLALLPPSSYHMTVFGGANDQNRGPDTWPADVPLDAPMHECSRILGERLRASGTYRVAPICMRVDTGEPPSDDAVFRVRLLPADAAEAAKLRDLRARLAKVFAIHRADHETYTFHISIGYWLAPQPPNEVADFLHAFARWRVILAERCSQIRLGTPEYCTFKDMYSFHREFYLPS